MPNPTARPAETRRTPDNLDELVREAMRGGGTDKLRAAFGEAAKAPPSPPVGGPASVQGGEPPQGAARVPGGEPLPDAARVRGVDPLPNAARALAVEAVPVAPGPAVGRPAPPLRWTDALQRAAQRVAMVESDPEALREALLDAEDALMVGFSTLSSPPLLPPIRQPWLLVIPPWGDPEELSRALGVDMATARLLVQGRWPRIGLRGDSPNLGRAPSAEHLPVSRDELLAIGSAIGVLAADAGDGWQVTEEAIWLADPQGGGVPARIDDVWLVVPGEVEMRVVRESPTENRWLRKRLAVAGAGGDRRVRVIDLHTAGGIYRLVEGVSRMEGVPGHDPNSARRTFTAVLNHLAARFPDSVVLDERICAIGADGKSAWPLWEEHTRVVRVYTGRTARPA